VLIVGVETCDRFHQEIHHSHENTKLHIAAINPAMVQGHEENVLNTRYGQHDREEKRGRRVSFVSNSPQSYEQNKEVGYVVDVWQSPKSCQGEDTELD